jgi:hypothetical protein
LIEQLSDDRVGRRDHDGNDDKPGHGLAEPYIDGINSSADRE